MRSTALHPAQYEVYIDQLMDPESPHYNVGVYLKLTGGLNTVILQKALQISIEKFDCFRQRFDLTHAEPKAFISDCLGEVNLIEKDFSGEDDPETQATTWMQKQFNSPFKLKISTLPFEFALLSLSSNTKWFYCRFHHLIIDGYGMKIFIDELTLTYKRFLN